MVVKVVISFIGEGYRDSFGNYSSCPNRLTSLVFTSSVEKAIEMVKKRFHYKDGLRIESASNQFQEESYALIAEKDYTGFNFVD